MFEFHLKHYLFTSFTWLHLLLLFLYHVDAQASMEPVPTDISHHNWEPSFAITVGAIICVLLFMGIISIYIRKCAESRIIITRTNPIGATNTNCPCSCSQGINKELLSTFPIIFYSTIKDLKTGKGPLECAVCLTDFKDQDTLRLLPKCNHVFHPQCIDSWLASHVTCPVCRANLNQDSCQVAITIPTHLTNDEEGSETRGESEENEIEPNPNLNQNQNQNLNLDLDLDPVVHKGDQGNCDDGGVSKSNLLRSNSTGHSMVEPVKCVERYTLRLPEDVRTYILVNHERSCSNNNIVKGLCWSDNEGSSIEKGINEEEKVERWVLCAPPFVTRHG